MFPSFSDVGSHAFFLWESRRGDCVPLMGDTLVQYAACPSASVIGREMGTIRFRLLWWGGDISEIDSLV